MSYLLLILEPPGQREAAMRPSALPYIVLFAGVLIASTASIMVRFAQGAGVAAAP